MRAQIQYSRYRIPRYLRGKKGPRPSLRTALVLIIALGVASVLSLQFGGKGRFFYYRLKSFIRAKYTQKTENISQAFSDSLRTQIPGTLAELGLKRELISEESLKKGVTKISVQVPADLPLVVCNLELSRLAKQLGGEVIHAVEYPRKGKVILQVGKQGKVTEEILLVKNRELRRKTGTIALIIDDFGNDLELAQRFCKLPPQVTFSVIPYLKHSREIAELAFRSGHEVMLHLPMEPQKISKNNPGKGAILVRYSTYRIRRLTRKALASIPHIKGVNNHMGSKATEDSRVMNAVLKEIKRENLFFVDSMTSPHSVGFEIARKMGIPCARRDVFIDNQNEQHSIEQQLLKLSRLAIEQQKTIGAGHAREKTLKALEEILPKLQKRGFKLVPASKIVK